jgi:hypothetical protein
MIISQKIKTEIQKLELITVIGLAVIFFIIGSYFNLFLVDIALMLSYSYLINSILRLNKLSFRDIMK